jgi:hypothetical protein
MKLFVKKQSKDELKQSIKAFAKSTGVKKVTYNCKAVYIEGSYNHKTRIIFISSRLPKKDTLSTFFHELAHHIACKRGIWKKYHTQVVTNPEYAFLVENRIDYLAKKLWNKYVDSAIWGKYQYTYKKANRRKHLNFLKIFYGIDS